MSVIMKTFLGLEVCAEVVNTEVASTMAHVITLAGEIKRIVISCSFFVYH
jgi:hypothetical protein